MSVRNQAITAAVTVGVGTALLITITAQAELLTHKDLTLAVAKTIAETAIADCKAKGYAVSAVVVDRAGDTLVAMRRREPAHNGKRAPQGLHST